MVSVWDGSGSKSFERTVIVLAPLSSRTVTVSSPACGVQSIGDRRRAGVAGHRAVDRLVLEAGGAADAGRRRERESRPTAPERHCRRPACRPPQRSSCACRSRCPARRAPRRGAASGSRPHTRRRCGATGRSPSASVDRPMFQRAGVRGEDGQQRCCCSHRRPAPSRTGRGWRPGSSTRRGSSESARRSGTSGTWTRSGRPESATDRS